MKGINDSATFINNIDTEFLSGDVGDMSMPLGGRDDSCEDDMRGETDDDVDVMDDDNDEDYVADESGSNSTDSDDIPLAKLRKIKKSKKVKKSKVVDSMVSESGDGCILLPGDDGGSQTGDSINESVSQSGDGHISQSDVSNSQAESSCPISEAAPSQTESLPSQSSMSQSGNPTQPTASRGRKRKREPKTWKRNVAKQRCNSGDSYINKHGVERPGRGMKKPCGTCRNKRSSIYTHENRQNIFHSFWQLGDINKQRQFIANYTEKKPKKTKTSKSNRRKSSITWFLPSSNGSKSNKVKVCKTFFLNTLGISDKMVTTVHKKLNNIGVCMDDQRGKSDNSRHNQTTETEKKYVQQHINSFETVESHYCRRNSKKVYLPQGLNITKMYRLYEKYCAALGAPKVSLYVYTEIFNLEFNIGFHKPLKDQCNTCMAFTNASDTEKEKKCLMSIKIT